MDRSSVSLFSLTVSAGALAQTLMDEARDLAADNKFDEAAVVLWRLVKAQPGLAPAWRALSFVLERLDRQRDAEFAAERAAALEAPG